MSRQFMVLIAIVGTLGAIAVPETSQDDSTVSVSYTHLTLPTIYSV